VESVRDAIRRMVADPIASASESAAVEIDYLKRLVEELARELDDFRRSLLVDQINERLDALKRRIDPHQGENR
jgi:hypothetical protein